ncbi:tyrosine-type recombinase/integrase [Saccharopolyspora sp. TS4A08]|uniref:Tyrosine-type recombinase/integrase n=1 Tax=Saccharopolyspora ipomoeae TaxID=3042027 RepID=A0ABT6PPG2_9PSEU|nr:tyrosine-type recombinase/integrase [Saccharopolyspora sp. TS4A08]MDI2029829.1 tyrosine-type recombinase/integrase [Saccharopolyspora sp. TS4A08]
METSYDVTIWQIKARKNAKGKVTSYRVRWLVDSHEHHKTIRNKTQAESFRSKLVVAASRGEAFLVAEPGLPVSMLRNKSGTPWFEFAQKYVDMKWKRAAAKSRSGIADTLATVTPALLTTERGRPDPEVLRRAMTGWAFNATHRDDPRPHEIEKALRWLAENTRPVSDLQDLALLRTVLEQLASKLNGEMASAKTFGRKRAVFHNALEYAVELKEVDLNQLPKVKWTPPKKARAIDKRTVAINPRQAERLLAAVEAQQVEGQPRRSSGPMLRAFFAVIYYSGLRPEEVAMLSKPDLLLPGDGWGELLPSKAAPVAGAAWTDSGSRRDRRQLKQRAEGEVRHVPCPPQLTKILHEHLSRHGTARDGRLFRNMDGGDVDETTVARVWRKARVQALTPEEAASPLVRRPYDLRHACVSTWLAAGVPSTQVAEWAGHSVTVLHEIYAKVLAGLEQNYRRRIQTVLDEAPE